MLAVTTYAKCMMRAKRRRGRKPSLTDALQIDFFALHTGLRYEILERNAFSVVKKDYFTRAVAAHFRTCSREGTIPQQPSNSSDVQTIGGRDYFVLESDHEILRVYRISNSGLLKELRRWPIEIDAISEKYVPQKSRAKIKSAKPPKPRESDKEFCEVGWILLTTERDVAVSMLDPENKNWKASAIEFAGSLRERKIVTVS
jgi:hypothetical protein